MYPYYELADPTRGVDAGLSYRSVKRIMLQTIARGDEPNDTVLYDQPLLDKKKCRVSGPFTVEALSRYAVNPTDEDISEPDPTGAEASDRVDMLLAALKTQGIPRPGDQPAVIESLTPLSAAGALQAEGVAELGGRRRRFAVALGPKFGAITMAQVSDALREAIGFELVVFAGFAVSADAQERLAAGMLGGTQVSLLLANPDLLVGDLPQGTRRHPPDVPGCTRHRTSRSNRTAADTGFLWRVWTPSTRQPGKSCPAGRPGSRRGSLTMTPTPASLVRVPGASLPGH